MTGRRERLGCVRLFAFCVIACSACNDDLGSPAAFAGAMATSTGGTGAAGTAVAPAAPTAGAPSTASGAAGARVAAGSGSPAAGTSAPAAGSSAGAAGSTATAGSSAIAGATATAGAGVGPDQPVAGAPVAGSSAAAGGAAIAGSGASGTGGNPPAMRMDRGKGDGSDVITIGDSWMSYAVNGGGIETGLRAASMQRYRNYGVAGTMLLNEVIPGQYTSAKRANPNIKTVVMTGGGNDLLLTGMTAGGCGSGCMMTIDRVAMRLGELWKEMAADGVQDVVYIEYSRGGNNKAGVEQGVAKVKPVCDSFTEPLRCHFVDSDPIIMMQLLDGVHPTADGCAKLGKATFDLMVKEGMRR